MKKEYILPSIKISEFHSAKLLTALSENKQPTAVQAAKDALTNTVEIKSVAVFELN